MKKAPYYYYYYYSFRNLEVAKSSWRPNIPTKKAKINWAELEKTRKIRVLKNLMGKLLDYIGRIK